jgi:hypothetical protein
MEATHMLTLWPQSFALLAFFLLLLSQKGPNMVTLPILPDEFVFGYFGRLLWSLGIEPGESDFSKAVQYRLGSRERPCQTLIIGKVVALADGDTLTVLDADHVSTRSGSRALTHQSASSRLDSGLSSTSQTWFLDTRLLPPPEN